MTGRRAGLAALVLLLGVLGLATVWQPRDPYAIDLAARHGETTLAHPMGTDHLGRDVLSRVMVGAGNTALVIGIVVTLSFSLGVLVGVTAGLAGGVVAGALIRLAEFVIAVPTLILALTITALLGLTPVTAGLALGLATWGPYGLLAYALTRRALGRPHVLAARALGVGGVGIATRHVLPVTADTLLTYLASDAGRTVVSYASLAFLGLGAETSRPDWGAMLFEYRGFMFDDPMLLIWPGLAITLTALVLNLALEPRVASDHVAAVRRPRSPWRGPSRRPASTGRRPTSPHAVARKET